MIQKMEGQHRPEEKRVIYTVHISKSWVFQVINENAVDNWLNMCTIHIHNVDNNNYLA